MNDTISGDGEMDVSEHSLHYLENIIEIIPTDCLPDQEQYPLSFYVNKVTLSVIQNGKTIASESYFDNLEVKKTSDDEIFKKPPSIDLIERQRKVTRNEIKNESRISKKRKKTKTVGFVQKPVENSSHYLSSP